jgi:hypothetical protein
MIKDIRPYFRSALTSLRYREWTDGFNFENIPSNVLNNTFHISTPSGARRGAYSQTSQEIEQDVVVRVFFKGFRNPAQAIDRSMEAYQDILEKCLGADRLGCSIKNVYLNTMQILPLAQTNDNSVILEVTFSCLIIINTGRA